VRLKFVNISESISVLQSTNVLHHYNLPITTPYNMATTDAIIDRVEFSDVTAPYVYKGHWVKAKVTGAKKSSSYCISAGVYGSGVLSLVYSWVWFAFDWKGVLFAHVLRFCSNTIFGGYRTKLKTNFAMWSEASQIWKRTFKIWGFPIKRRLKSVLDLRRRISTSSFRTKHAIDREKGS